MAARRDSIEQTRLRITEAAVRLHQEVGPAATTVSAIADQAGVTRLTVYRHFPDDEAIIASCSAHWRAEHPAPDPAEWAGVPDPTERLGRALRDTYAWWPSAAPMMRKVLRDLDRMPGFARENVERDEANRVRVLVRGLASTPAGRRRARAAVRHALALHTWQSLCVQGGLSRDEAVDLMTRLVLDAAAVTPRRRPGGR